MPISRRAAMGLVVALGLAALIVVFLRWITVRSRREQEPLIPPMRLEGFEPVDPPPDADDAGAR